MIRQDYPGLLEAFLEPAFDNFRLNRDKYRLSTLLGLHAQAKNHPYSDVAFILASVVFEGLKDAYASRVRRYPQDRRGFYLKPGGGTYSFKQLVRELFRYWHLRSGGVTFVDLRNRFFHTGEPGPRARARFRKEYRKTIDQIDRLLLAILGYKGKYVPFLQQSEILFQ